MLKNFDLLDPILSRYSLMWYFYALFLNDKYIVPFTLCLCGFILLRALTSLGINSSLSSVALLDFILRSNSVIVIGFLSLLCLEENKRFVYFALYPCFLMLFHITNTYE